MKTFDKLLVLGTICAVLILSASSLKTLTEGAPTQPQIEKELSELEGKLNESLQEFKELKKALSVTPDTLTEKDLVKMKETEEKILRFLTAYLGKPTKEHIEDLKDAVESLNKYFENFSKRHKTTVEEAQKIEEIKTEEEPADAAAEAMEQPIETMAETAAAATQETPIEEEETPIEEEVEEPEAEAEIEAPAPVAEPIPGPVAEATEEESENAFAAMMAEQAKPVEATAPAEVAK